MSLLVAVAPLKIEMLRQPGEENYCKKFEMRKNNLQKKTIAKNEK